MALTRRQKQALDFIDEFIRDNGYSPSFGEIATGLGLASIATVHKHLTALEGKGYLIRSFNQSRSLDLGPQYYEERNARREDRAEADMIAAALEAPLLGSIAAGQPIETYADPGTLSFAPFCGVDSVYALRVQGESMIEDHIIEGDYVLVEKITSEKVRSGEIVVVLVGGEETTLKRFYRESGSMARLQPANSQMEPIMIPLAELSIQGRVLAVHRQYR